MLKRTIGVISFGVLGLAHGSAMGQCIVPDNGFGTATMPPDCTYFTFDDDMRIVDGLPFGTTIEIDARITDIFNVVEVNGGALGGTTTSYDSLLILPMEGTGALAGFSRFIGMQLPSASNFFVCAPRVAADPVQSFDTEMRAMTGEVFGDPDFDVLRVKAGVANGLPPSPGHTVLGAKGANMWQVDSFFDITYTIEFQGAPGSFLEGFGGVTEATVRFSTDFCPTDLNNDGVTDTADLGILIAEFGTPGVLADLNNDGVVDTADLGIMISQFGQFCFPV